MSSVGQFVIWCFQSNLFKCIYIEVYRNVEAVGIVFPIRNPRNHAVFFPVNSYETSGKAFCRRGNQRPIKAGSSCFLIHAFSHIAYNFKTQVLGFLGFSVMNSNESLQALCQSDKTNCKGSVLYYLFDGVVRSKLFRIQPYPLSHKEWKIFNLLL